MASFNSRPSCDGRPQTKNHKPRRKVSIHARRATGDLLRYKVDDADWFQFTPVVRRATGVKDNIARARGFNSRPSCDGRRISRSLTPFQRSFNSRPSCDGRLVSTLNDGDAKCFNSRPSCDGRPGKPARANHEKVSIHARRATGDSKSASSPSSHKFQFTPVVRRATSRANVQIFRAIVSIHARRATGDRPPFCGDFVARRFNSRPSCDGRPNEQQ